MSKYIMGKGLQLHQIVMPGSHDAGVFDGMANSGKLGNTGWAICQNGDLAHQLDAGSRVFDLRARVVRATNTVGQGNHSNVRFYHGGKKGGSKGGGVEVELHNVKAFLDANTSEFCILRLTKSGGCCDEVMDIVKTILGDRLYRFPGNIATHLVELMRGKAIVVFDGTFKGHDQREGLHFYKKNDGVPLGLGIQGEYSKSSYSSRVVRKQEEKLQRARRNGLQGDRLYCWYQTQTATFTGVISFQGLNVRDMHDGGIGSQARTRHLKEQLRDNTDFDCINIVMMDFVDNFKCRLIYRRNNMIGQGRRVSRAPMEMPRGPIDGR
jgi:hypothetical protein